MSDEGDEIKDLFEEVYLGEMGSDVIVYHNWNAPSMTSFETRAWKEQEKGITVFEFKLGTKVYTDNVIQIVDGRDFWRVEDVEDEVQLGSRIKHVARVTKINQQGNPIQINSEGRAVYYTTNIQGHNYGAIAQGGQGHTQNVNIQITSFDEAANKLLDLIEKSDLSPVNKITVKGDIQTLIQLNGLEKTSEVKETAISKLSVLDKTLSVSADLYSLVTPLMPLLLAPFQ